MYRTGGIDCCVAFAQARADPPEPGSVLHPAEPLARCGERRGAVRTQPYWPLRPALIVDSASRQVVTSLAQAVPLSTTLNITSYQVLYRTTGAVGDPQATVVTLLIPASARKNQLVNYAIAYDTAEWDCSPSYALQPGTPTNGAVTQEEPLILGFLVAGWTVAVSDYEGPRAVYTNGHLEGRQFLHGVRAALNFPPAQLSADTQIAQVGYSGGAMASGWGAILSGTCALLPSRQLLTPCRCAGNEHCRHGDRRRAGQCDRDPAASRCASASMLFADLHRRWPGLWHDLRRDRG